MRRLPRTTPSKVARDRDRLRQDVLDRLGWRIHRIWGTAWYRNRPEQEQRLRAAIDSAIGGDQQPVRSHKAETVRPSGMSYDKVSLDEAPAWTIAYRVAMRQRPTRRLEMHVPEAQADMRRMISDVVATEGPIAETLALRRVREAWGVGRAGTRIRDAFDRAVAALVRRGDLQKVENGFLAVSPDQLTAVRVPGEDPEARRSVEEIPRSELKLAVLHLAGDARRVSRDDLTFEVARLFGWNRRAPDIAAALDGAVDDLVRVGEISEDAGYLKPLQD